MVPHKTAPQQWDKLNGCRLTVLRRSEKYAKWTIPKVFPHESYNQNTDELNNDWNSLGAQAVNHLSNKLMMSLFAPSRPFFRLGPKKRVQEQLASLPPEKVREMENRLAVAERAASDVIDKQALRSKLYELIKLLIITGNGLMILRDKSMRVLNMRNFVVRRDVNGDVIELLIKEVVTTEELDKDAYTLAQRSGQFSADADGKVCHYRWVQLRDGKFHETQWYNGWQLPAAYSSAYAKGKLPYYVPTWDLSSGNHYGTGLVEDYKGDFAAIAALSESTIYAAIMNSEFRWVLRAGAMTSAQDLANSRNGDVLYGEQGDITPVASGLEAKLDTNLAVAETYVRRIGAAFLLQSAVTRNAERVTTAEFRGNAEELEGGLGGAYSRLAGGVQLPLADFCLDVSGYKVNGTDFEATILTGLAALSRVGDRDRLIAFLQSLTPLNNLPPQVLDRMKLSSFMSDMASAEGLSRDSYVTTDEEYQQMMQQRAEQQQAMQNQQAAVAAELQQRGQQ